MIGYSIRGARFVALAATALIAGSAHAQTLAGIKTSVEAAASSPQVETFTSNPVVTEIVTSTSTYETLLIQDGTGAIEVYKVPVSSTTYTPAVGDTVAGTADFTSYHGLWEMEPTYTSFTKTGTASLPAPVTFTTTGLTNGSAVGQAEQNELGTLYGVTFGTTGTFVSGTDYTVSDAFGSTQIYIASGTSFIGQAIPTGPVNIYGYLGQYDSAATAFGSGAYSVNGYEIDPLSINAVTSSATTPEPTSLIGVVTGAIAVVGGFVRRRKSP